MFLAIHVTWGGCSHTWVWFRGSAVMTPVFEICDPIGPLIYASARSDSPLLSAEKIILYQFSP